MRGFTVRVTNALWRFFEASADVLHIPPHLLVFLYVAHILVTTLLLVAFEA